MKKNHTDCKIGNNFDGTTGNSSIIDNQKCEHILPCGVCDKTGMICPLNGYKEPTITW